MVFNKKSTKWKYEEQKQPPEVYDNNHEIRHLRKFRKIKELPHKANKSTRKREKLQEYCITRIIEARADLEGVT